MPGIGTSSGKGVVIVGVAVLTTACVGLVIEDAEGVLTSPVLVICCASGDVPEALVPVFGIVRLGFFLGSGLAGILFDSDRVAVVEGCW